MVTLWSLTTSIETAYLKENTARFKDESFSAVQGSNQCLL
jgi:hypothetical protein